MNRWIHRAWHPLQTAAVGLMAVASIACSRTEEKEKPAEQHHAPVALSITRPEDLHALIHDQLAAGTKRITIPPGRYRVTAKYGTHLLLQNLDNVEIIADGVELVCSSTVAALRLVRCTHVTIRGLSIDYEPLPFTQGTITSLAKDKSWLVFEVARGYPETKLDERIQIYHPETGMLRRGDAPWHEKIEALGHGRYRVTKAGQYRFDPEQDTEQVGDILVTNNLVGASGPPHAVELTHCRDTVLERITLFSSPCFGFLENHCHASRYLQCRIDRRPPEDDPVKRSQPRMRSLNADAFHSKDASKGPSIIGCTARYHGDDCVNINGRYHYLSSRRGRELRIAVLDKNLTIKPGDPVEFLPWSGPRPADAVAVDVRVDPQPVTDTEKAFIAKLRLDARMKSTLLEGKATFHTLVLDREVDLPPGSAVCCPARLGHGFAIKDCDFGSNRSRGILIKASQGEISGNRIIGSRMAAILVSPEFWWMEAGISSDLVIKDNLIKGCLDTPVRILARGGSGGVMAAGAHRNITIHHNRFEDCEWPIIHVTSTSGLSIRDNFFPEARGSAGKLPDPVLLEHCRTAD